MDEPSAETRPPSTRCRYCGNDENGPVAAATREREHYQVVVACASCGRAFAVLSRN